ncbi:VOC family protein [Xanthobacter oligotrophicus]|uniref:VOC family protein n=1 Tax=Xanthobacter oligotrophicus TaxID=2607286 RepID=UPI0011F17920|nr:VOC family protein [Xanthobacter oligotrophicus]MCG5235244.1 VOC family protein [Xanthobacter oligotrophicus]
MTFPSVRPVIEHLSITTVDLPRAVRFYDAVLAPLGLVRVADYDEPEGASACWGPPGTIPAPEGAMGAAPFWVQLRDGPVSPPPGTHIAFCAADEAAVAAFHAAGLVAGGMDYGAPGLRPQYGPGYYAAFLKDPDGWRIEAVTFV